MPSLSRADDRFGTTLTLLEGGSGEFTGLITEPAASAQLTLPRQLLRVAPRVPIKPGMVIRNSEGGVFMVGTMGDSDQREGHIFRSFYLFRADGQYQWQRRGKIVDPITRLPKDDGLQDHGLIWGVYEPAPELFDKGMHMSFESGRFITAAPVQRDDVVNNRKVSRVDPQLGLYIATLG